MKATVGNSIRPWFLSGTLKRRWPQARVSGVEEERPIASFQIAAPLQPAPEFYRRPFLVD